MGVIIAIDFGTKKTGLAETDPMHMIASPLTTVQTSTLIDYLREYHQRQSIETIVVGQPMRHSGEFSDVETDILKWIKRFEKQLPEITVARYDERFTSKIASGAILEMGIKKSKRRDKTMIDKISATLILQDYLDKNKR